MGKFVFETSREIWRNPSVSDFRILDGMIIDLSGGTNPVDNTIGNLRSGLDPFWWVPYE